VIPQTVQLIVNPTDDANGDLNIYETRIKKKPKHGFFNQATN
jgi:hypothetical protein